MSIYQLTDLFMWCTIINVGLLLLWAVCWLTARDWIYNVHNKWFPMSREKHNVAFYYFMGGFKMLVIVFNVTPYVALLIVC